MAETVGVALRVTSDHRNEGECEEDEDQNQFASGEPEFSLPVETDGHDIQCARHARSVHHSQKSSPPVAAKATGKG